MSIKSAFHIVLFVGYACSMYPVFNWLRYSLVLPIPLVMFLVGTVTVFFSLYITKVFLDTMGRP